eukprot:366197-Chlamydomonas_euryale.AAC.11
MNIQSDPSHPMCRSPFQYFSLHRDDWLHAFLAQPVQPFSHPASSQPKAYPVDTTSMPTCGHSMRNGRVSKPSPSSTTWR